MTGGWLEYSYCSITVFNYRLIRLIRFGSQSCTYLQIFFINRLHLILHLILHSCKILFSQKVFRGNQTWVTACLWKLISLSLPTAIFKSFNKFCFAKCLVPFWAILRPNSFLDDGNYILAQKLGRGSIPRNATISLRRDEIPTILFF